MQLSGGGDHTVWKIWDVLTGDFRHFHSDGFIKRHVLQDRLGIGNRSMKVVSAFARILAFSARLMAETPIYGPPWQLCRR